MQNFDVFLPTSQTTSSRDAAPTFTPKKSATGGEKFDDVMHRALSGPARESHSDDADTQVSDRPDKQVADDSLSAHHSKHTHKSKKPLHRESGKGDTTTAQPNAANISSLQISHLLSAQIIPVQTVTDDEGTSENKSETGTSDGKNVAPAGTITDASQLVASQLVAAQLLALPGATLPVSTPSLSTSSTGKGASNEIKNVKEISNPILNRTAKTEAPTSAPDSTLDLAAVSKQDDKSVKPDSDPKIAEMKNPAEHSEKATAPEKTGIQLPHGLVTQTAETLSDKTESLGIQADTSAADAQNAQSTDSKASATNVSAFASDVHGTSVAKQDMTMKKVEKTPKVAEAAEQDLPGNSATGSDELSDGQKLSTKTSGNTKAEPVSATETASKISTSVQPAAPNITTTAVTPAAETDGRFRVLERTHDIVALHAMRLGETGSDSLHVVVKPGDGIQLSLELRKSSNGIEVQASLHKGDFEHMKQYWPELQQRLESRGVRVGTLTTSENFTSSSQQQFQQSKQQQTSDQDPMHAGAFAEFALAGSMSEAPAARAARATAYRGWETWA